MVLDTDKIQDLNYQIRRIRLDIKNLERTIETKRRNRFLDAGTEQALRQQIDARMGRIASMQAEIRRIENEAQRAQKLKEGLG